MRTVTLADGTAVPALGLGTWRFGENAGNRARDIDAVRVALQLGYRLIDTAEMYGSGGAEQVVGRALVAAIAAGELRREDVFVVSKVLPSHADQRGVAAACKASLDRLGIEQLDLYLLHWRGPVPLAHTVDALERLRDDGLIRRWGVSNFDVIDMEDLLRLPGGAQCAANQVYYSVAQRGVEFDLLPWQRTRGIATMAYSPIDQGALAKQTALATVGARHGLTATQVALAWAVRAPDVIAIPQSGRIEHLRDNLAAAALTLDANDLAALDRAFPPPTRKRPLAMT